MSFFRYTEEIAVIYGRNSRQKTGYTEEIAVYKKKPNSFSVYYFFKLYLHHNQINQKRMARPLKVENQMMQQSNYFTTARYDYTAQEKRILYRVAEKAYEYRMANKEWFEQHDGEFVANEHVSFTMPITKFMNKEQLENSGGEQYEQVVEAFKSLVDKRISFRGKGCFSFGGILNYADQNKGEGTISFMVHKFVWQSALDFTKGFTKLDLVVAMELKSAYSMRFFEFAKQWSDRMHCVITVEEFREMFRCQDKYPAIYDIKRYIIDNAKEELDRVAPMSFDYECNKEGREIKSFTFHFYEINKNKREEETRKELLSKYPQAVIRPEIKQWLRDKMGFNQAQLRSNVKLIDELQRAFQNDTVPELEETFQYIAKQGFRPQENVGWFIQNLKKKVENTKL